MIATMQAPQATETIPANGLISLTGDSIESVTEQLLAHAARLQSSDVFLCSNEQCVIAQVRHLGIVRPLAVMPAEQGKRVITLIKARALMDLAEKRRPQEGRWIFQHAGANGTAAYDLRISTIPTVFGEDMAACACSTAPASSSRSTTWASSARSAMRSAVSSILPAA